MPTVTTVSTWQVTGTQMMAPPVGHTNPRGIRSTAVPTVLPPQPGPSWPTTLTMGHWIMDPSGKFVLILNEDGLTLYQVQSGDPTSGSFVGDAVFPSVGAGGIYFCAQSDGNAVVYDSSFPEKLNPTWKANNGTSGSAQYLFVQENGCFVTIQCHGIWGSPL